MPIANLRISQPPKLGEAISYNKSLSIHILLVLFFWEADSNTALLLGFSNPGPPPLELDARSLIPAIYYHQLFLSLPSVHSLSGIMITSEL